MSTVESTVEELEGVLGYLEQCYVRGYVHPSTYYQNLVTLASDWVCTHHDVEKALILLNRCPPSYFLDSCYNQASLDVFFQEAVVNLSRTLIQYGFGPDGSKAAFLPEARA